MVWEGQSAGNRQDTAPRISCSTQGYLISLFSFWKQWSKRRPIPFEHLLVWSAPWAHMVLLTRSMPVVAASAYEYQKFKTEISCWTKAALTSGATTMVTSFLNVSNSHQRGTDSPE